jgi:NAD(P)-dependent dehydrogenase (short-subunit alcohol dehydrogenase family)
MKPNELFDMSGVVGTSLPLCSAAGRWITGQTYLVDGGWIMRL